MVLALSIALMGAQDLDLKFIGTGMTGKLGGYSPVRAEMTGSQDDFKLPSGISSAKIGTFKFGESDWAFVVSEADAANHRIWVDSNDNSDFTDDAKVEWKKSTYGTGLTQYTGSAKINLNGGATVNFYRFDPNDPSRAALANTLLFYGDFGYEGTGMFGGKTLPVRIGGIITPTSSVFIDRNGSGSNDGPSETFGIAKPFNIGGTVYVLNLDGQSVSIGKSDATVAEIPLPPNLNAGQITPSFTATSMSGKTINFPSSYKGKVVLLDFWATWCGPCIAELPNVLANYEKFHPQGLEMLGISFDQANMADKVASFTAEQKMTWEHVYEGKYWNTTIGTQFNIRGIPFMMLVDGDTGKILASGNSIRGEKLGSTLEKIFAERAANR